MGPTEDPEIVDARLKALQRTMSQVVNPRLNRMQSLVRVDHRERKKHHTPWWC